MDGSVNKLQEMVKAGKPGALQPARHRESDTTEQLNK